VTLSRLYVCLFSLCECLSCTDPASWLPESNTCYVMLDAAARLLYGASARTHAPRLLMQLHWLPVSSRIQLKLCTLMFDIYHGTAPQYLCDRPALWWHPPSV